jgi:dolichol-phosphate mannosyltransferase
MTNHSAASPMTSPRVLVALATYNEINNLPSLVDEICRILPDAQLLIIDDNSPDGTGRWCDERARTEPRLRYDVLITMDADWSHDPQFLPALVAATVHADVALGSRYCNGGAIDGWPLHRRVGSRLMNGLSRVLLRLPVRDASGAFRAYRIAALRRIDLASIRSTGYAYLEETLWHLYRAGASLVEVPITFHQRRAGESKINAQEAIGKLGTLLRLASSRSPRSSE